MPVGEGTIAFEALLSRAAPSIHSSFLPSFLPSFLLSRQLNFSAFNYGFLRHVNGFPRGSSGYILERRGARTRSKLIA